MAKLPFAHLLRSGKSLIFEQFFLFEQKLVRKHCHSVSVAQNRSLCTSKFEKLPFSFPVFAVLPNQVHLVVNLMVELLRRKFDAGVYLKQYIVQSKYFRQGLTIWLIAPLDFWR